MNTWSSTRTRAGHGHPRATRDSDVWIRRSADDATRVWAALIEFGAPLDQLSFAGFLTPGMVVPFGVSPRRIDAATSTSGVEFDPAYERRIVVEIEDLHIPILGRSDLIENKRAAGRAKDLLDVALYERSRVVNSRKIHVD